MACNLRIEQPMYGSIMILFALLVQASANDQMDEMFDRALTASIPKDLDQVTNGKAGQLAKVGPGSSTGKVAVRGAHAQVGLATTGRVVLPPAGAMHPAGALGYGAAHPASALGGFGGVVHPGPSHRTGIVARAETAQIDGNTPIPNDGEEYEITQPRPIGVKWVKCADGGIYAGQLDRFADPRLQLGDKLLAVSASFGDEVWPADSYQQTQMAIKTRNGDIYMKILSRGGDDAILSVKAEKSAFQSERAGGNYGQGTQAEQTKRYVSAKEVEQERIELFNKGLAKFNEADYQEALDIWQQVQVKEPENYVGDDFSRVTNIYRVTAYNIACAYSKMGDEEAGLSALRDAMNSGFDDYKKIRADPNLEFVRNAPDGRFNKLIDQFDEPLISREAMDALKNIKLPWR